MLTVLNMSLTASIVIIFVLVARLFLRKAPKIFSYALWGVVLFRLLCPVSISSDFSLLGVLDRTAAPVTQHTTTVEHIPQDVVTVPAPNLPDITVPAPDADRPADGGNVQQPSTPTAPINPSIGVTDDIKPSPAEPAESILDIFSVIWLTGIALMLLYSAVSLLRLCRRLTGAVKLRDNIYIADHIDTPFVMGLLRARIYLPSSLSEREQRYILLHEQQHIRRLDHIIKALAFLALCIHWFNPMVWLAFVLSAKDMEMSCDEAVMKKLGEEIRAEYSASLLSLATGRRVIAGTPLAFGEGDTKSRIKNVLNWKKPKTWIILAAAVLCVAVVIFCAGNPAGDTSEDETPGNDTSQGDEADQSGDVTQDDGEQGSGDEEETEISDELAYVLRRLGTLRPEDIESFDTMPADAEIVVPLIHAAAESYTTDYISDNMGEWRLLLELSENPEDPALSSERFILAIDTREGIVDVTYLEDAESHPSDWLELRLYSVDLWEYIFSLYNRDGIDLEAMANFEDILSARAQQTMEHHNTTMVERGYPAFTGFDLTYLRLVDSFSYGIYYYQIYRWDAAFLTDDPDPSRYAWYQNQYVDEQNRIGNYEWCIYFVAAWVHDDLEYEFYNDYLYPPSGLRARALIIEDFDDTKIYLEGTDGDNGDAVYTRDGISISIPDDFHLQIKVCDNPDTWRYGMVMNPVYYLDNPYMTDQTLFSLFHSCEYVNDGSGLIFSIRRYTEEEYKYYYLNSYSRQQVFARDENYYYCVFIPTGASQDDPETAEKLAALLERQLDKILNDMIERNGWQAYNGEESNNVQISVRDVSVVPEEYREIITARAEDTVAQHNAVCEEREQPFFTGYEVLSFEPKDSFKRDGADYEIYQWEIVFHTDDPNADSYQWGGSPFADDQYRIHYYDQDTFFVVYRNGGDVRWDFFHFDLYSDPQDVVFDLLVEHFDPATP